MCSSTTITGWNGTGTILQAGSYVGVLGLIPQCAGLLYVPFDTQFPNNCTSVVVVSGDWGAPTVQNSAGVVSCSASGSFGYTFDPTFGFAALWAGGSTGLVRVNWIAVGS